MKKGTSRAIVLIFSIICIIALIVIAFKFTLSKDGAVTKVVEDEKKYNNEEVVEEINLTIRKIYIDSYKVSVDNSINIEQVYNEENVLTRLIQDGLIEKYVKISDDNKKEEVKDKYLVRVSNLKMDITSGTGVNGTDKDIYTIEKKDASNEFVVRYYNNKSEMQEIGKLNFKPEV